MSTFASAGAAISQRVGKFYLINLCGGGTFVFKFFPAAIETSRHANWQDQDTTTGTKPLAYFNRDPKKPAVPEVWLDNTDTGASITPQMKALFALQDETCEGAPPPLLAVWGDRQERCVLEDIRVSEEFFAPGGWPIRAKVSLSLKEVQ